jgi:Putative Flp pilus-assembly TadE/G-like
MRRPDGSRGRGQVLAVVALGMVVLVSMVGLVIDGGFAWVHRREVQNAADLASIAGARIVALYTAASPVPPGGDGEVRAAVEGALADNGGPAVRCSGGVTHDCYAAVYANASGGQLGTPVGSGAIPGSARGVRVMVTRSFPTTFIRIAGFASVDAAAPATARAGFAPTVGGPSGTLVPIGMTIDEDLWNTGFCPPNLAASACGSVTLTRSLEGRDHDGAPAQHSWMSWNGNDTVGYLCSILYPANSPEYTIRRNDHIRIAGSGGVSDASCLRGDVMSWVNARTTVIVPIISPGPPPDGETCGSAPGHCYPNRQPYPDPGQGTGNNISYNVIGFAGAQLVGCGTSCLERLQVVFRQAVFLGPTGPVEDINGTPGQPIAIQLVD